MIDVIIPAYNCHKTIRRTLSSLESQIDTLFNVILVDDNSDESLEYVVNDYIDHKILNIQYIRNSENLGCGMCRQVGVNNSTGDYITFLDADDIFVPYSIKVMNDALTNKPDADVICCQFYVHKEDKLRTMIDKTHCHGKLYKRSFLNKYNITANPNVRWADDSYFNSQCFELADQTIFLKYPIYIWMRNPESVTYSDGYKKHSISDFIYAMRLAIVEISKYKDIKDITFIDGIIGNINHMCIKNAMLMSNEEKQHIRSELRSLEKLISRKIDIVV